jgi:ribonuclease P protein component
MSQTYGKHERLTKREFRTRAWKKSSRSNHFLLFEKKNQESTKKFGVVIDRRIKGAVRRNRIRRLLKEFFRLNKNLFRDCHDHFVRVNKMPENPEWLPVTEELRILLGCSRQ